MPKITIFAMIIWLGGCAPRLPPGPPAAGSTTVVWISIDGFGHDYLERFHPPMLSWLATHGAFTTAERPVFPSLTFPNHISQATGVTVDRHGIVGNSFYDDADATLYDYPNDGRLLRAEPIWITAQRQGVPTAVIDWPMSQVQPGPVVTAVHSGPFDKNETDRHRLDRTLAAIVGKPIRLVMTYLAGVDHAGHAAGPDSPETAAAVAAADREIDHFLAGLTAWFDKTHSADDELVVLITSDHGMTAVKTMVNLDRLLGADVASSSKIVTSGPVGMVHCPPGDVGMVVERLKPLDFLTAWPAADVPPADHYADPSRLGSVVVLLKPGYAYINTRAVTTAPAVGPKGMHGYDPAVCPDMAAAAFVWRHRHPLGGKDLGPVDNTQWDATVCRWLGITPPAGVGPAVAGSDNPR